MLPTVQLLILLMTHIIFTLLKLHLVTLLMTRLFTFLTVTYDIYSSLNVIN